MRLFTICNKSQVYPECVSEVSAQNTLQINYYVILKCLFWVEAETGCFRACLFKCKWAAAPIPLSRIGLCLYSCTSDTLLKKICLVLIIMSIVLKSCILNSISLKLLIDERQFLSAQHPKHTHKKRLFTLHVSTKLSSLSCLIALITCQIHTSLC